ncbi:hypothetical protein CF319_g925 [Tilletia indica]|nr:hypothetical protein CF319_g925 [Tilletia indica]
MSFSSASGGSASAGSTAPSSLFTEEEARFMRDSFHNLQESFDPFQVGAPGFKVPTVLPPTAGGLPPFQHHHFNGSHSSLGSSSLAHGSDTTIGRSIHSAATTAASPSSHQHHQYYGGGPGSQGGPHSPATPTNHGGEGVTPSSTATASPPPATSSAGMTSSDAIALARLKNSESWERNAAKQQPPTFFNQSWWSSTQQQQQQQQHNQQQQQQRPPLNAQEPSSSDLRSTNISPTSMDTASTHSRSSSALDALMLGMGPASSGPPLSAPPSDPYADLLHLQDKGRSPDGGLSAAEAGSSRLRSATHDPYDHMRSGSAADGSAGRPGYRDDGSSYPLTSAPGESYVDLYNLRDTADQVRKQRAAAAAAAAATSQSGWAPPPQLIATLQQQQQQHRQHHQHQLHDQLNQHQQQSMQLPPQLGLYDQPQHQQQPQTPGPGTQATASGGYGQDKAWQMEQLNNLQMEREKWASQQQRQNGQAVSPAAALPGSSPSAAGDHSTNRPILSLSKTRNRSTSNAVGTPPTPSSAGGISAAQASAAAAAAAVASSQGSRLASTFATRRAPLVRPPRQAIRVNVDLARGQMPEQIGWAFFTAETSDRAQAHVDGIVDLRKGPVLEDGGKGENEASGSGSTSAETSAVGAAGKKLKAGHVLLTEAEKKANHIASEQKRRANIRKGYEMLCDIVPPLKEALEREATSKDGGGGGMAAADEDDEDDEDGGTTGRGKKKRKTKAKKRDPDMAGCEIGGERIDGRAGPRSEAIVLMKSIEYLRDLLEIRRDLLLRRDHARYQAAQMCGVNIATYLGPPVLSEAARGSNGAGPSYYTNGGDDGKGDDAMQH